jgi:UDP-glucose-4-epimerase GalE
VRQLALAGHEPIVFDSLRTGSPEAAGDAPLIVGDITDPAAVDAAFVGRSIGAVIHLAALKSPFESLADPGRYFAVNTDGTRILLDAMRRHGVAALVYSSSCAVYGIPERLPIDEGAATVPTTPYGESKLLAERMLPWYRAGGLRYAALRYFNAAGAVEDASLGEDWSTAINLVPVVLKAALGHGPPVEVFGEDYDTPDGTAIRDYIHVLDLADAHVAATELLAREDTAVTLNLGTGRGASVREVLSAAERATGRSVPARFVARRPGDPPAVYADPSRAAQVLGWRAERDLDAIVTTAARWHERRPAGFASAAIGG